MYAVESLDVGKAPKSSKQGIIVVAQKPSKVLGRVDVGLGGPLPWTRLSSWTGKAGGPWKIIERLG